MNVIFRRIIQELVKGRFQHTVAKCQANIKVLKYNTNNFLNRVRRSGACHELDKEMGVPLYFQLHVKTDVLMAGRTAVMSVMSEMGVPLYFQLYVKTDTLTAGTLCQPHVLDSERKRK